MIWKKKNAAMQGNDPAAAAANDKTAGKLAGAKAFARKNWKWLVPAAVVVLAGGVFLLKPANDKQANVDTSYVETAPEERDVSNSLSGTGTLNPANTYTVKSLVDGKVLTADFEEGDTVEEGTTSTPSTAPTLPPTWKKRRSPSSRPSAATIRR